MSAARSSTNDPSARGPDPATRASTRGRGVRAVLVAVLALVAVAFAAPAASAQAQANWPCDAFGYLFQDRSAPGSPDTGPFEIVRVDIATGEQTVIGNTPNTVNATGYNAVDGFFYGMKATHDPVTGYTWTLVRVHPDGSLDELGVPTGPGGTMN
jgi:hypothetical protein